MIPDRRCSSGSTFRRQLIAIVALLSVTGVPAFSQGREGEANGSSLIVTQGFASLRRTPDRAWVTISVEARDGKAANARRRAATQMNAVQGTIKAAGVPAEAIKTAGFSLQPQMEWDGSRARTREYAVLNQIEVRIDLVDLLADILDAAGATKTNGNVSVSIAGLRFDLKDKATSEEQVLSMAVKDAMARAQSMAAGAGRSLGTIVRLEEQRLVEEPRLVRTSFAEMRTREARGAGAGGLQGALNTPLSSDTPIEPNEIEFRAQVSLTVGIR